MRIEILKLEEEASRAVRMGGPSVPVALRVLVVSGLGTRVGGRTPAMRTFLMGDIVVVSGSVGWCWMVRLLIEKMVIS